MHISVVVLLSFVVWVLGRCLVVWECLCSIFGWGGLRGVLGGLLEVFGALGPLLGDLGSVLAGLGRSWAALGRFWAALDRS